MQLITDKNWTGHSSRHDAPCSRMLQPTWRERVRGITEWRKWREPDSRPPVQCCIIYRLANFTSVHFTWFITTNPSLFRVNKHVLSRLRGGQPRFDYRQWNDSLLHSVQTGSGAHWTCCPVGTGVLSPRVQRLGHETAHLRPSGAEVKKWSFPLHHAFLCRGAWLTL
jgi:hypothetical protein